MKTLKKLFSVLLAVSMVMAFTPVSAVAAQGGSGEGYALGGALGDPMVAPAGTHIPVSVVWDDDDDSEGLRPGSVDVTLYRYGGEFDVATATAMGTVTLAPGTNWAGYFDISGAQLETEEGIAFNWAAIAQDVEEYNGTLTGPSVTYTYMSVEDEWDDSQKQCSDLDINLASTLLCVKVGNSYVIWSYVPLTDAEKHMVFDSAKAGISGFGQGDFNKCTFIYGVGAHGHGITVYNDHIHFDTPSSFSFQAQGAVRYANVVTGAVVVTEVLDWDVPVETKTIYVQKEWEGDAAADRPASVVVQLYANGQPVPEATCTLVAGGDVAWGDEFADVPVYDENNEPITYTVREVDVPQGYTSFIEEAFEDYFVITNSKKIDVTVTKVWDDADDQDGVRPDSVSFQLLANGAPVNGGNLTLTPNDVDNQGNWVGTIVGLPAKDAAGQTIVYTLNEVDVADYDVVVTGSAAAGFAVTNTYTPATIDIDVAKVWDDEDNNDGKRPTSITVQLTIDGAPVDGKTITLSAASTDADGNWTGTFEDLPQKANGQEINYGVIETKVAGYDDPAYSGAIATGFIVTNARTPETFDIPVVKVWDDADDQDGARPDSVTINLYVAGSTTAADSITLTADDADADGNWAGAFEGLRVYSNGTAITYTVGEVAIDDYDSVITGNQTDGFTVTNTHEPSVISIDVTKVWDDADDQDGLRPQSVQVQLTLDGTPVEGQVATLSPGTTDADGNWTGVFSGLPEFADGQAIAYGVTETQVSGYKAPVVTGSIAAGFTVTNSHVPSTIDVVVTKVWDDESDNDGKRPGTITIQLTIDGAPVDGKTLELTPNDVTPDGSWSSSFEGLPEFANGQAINYGVVETKVNGYDDPTYTGEIATGFVVTNSRTPDTFDIPVVKVWDDADDQDGVRPESVTLQVFAIGSLTAADSITLTAADVDADGNWAGVFEDLRVYSNGTAITYTVAEASMDLYDSVVTGNQNDGFVVTNSYEPSTIDVAVTKVWDDADNQDGARPQSVQIQLTIDGTPVSGQVLTLTAADEDSNGNWSGTFNGLPEFADGQAIAYGVTETTVAGYKAPAYSGSLTSGFVVTNSYDPSTIDVAVTKIWDDADDQDGARPQSVQVQLTIDGAPVDGQVLTLTAADEDADGNWTGAFTGLDEYADGVAIAYGVQELEVSGYKTPVYGGSIAGGFTITNSYEPSVVNIDVTKVWDDADNQDGLRPSSVTVQLTIDGTPVEGQVVTLSAATTDADGNWIGVFAGLDEFADGQAIAYGVVETQVSGYRTPVYTGSVVDGFTVTNTHVPTTVDIDVTKVWDDEDDNDGMRPSSITVQLTVNGNPVDGKTLDLTPNGVDAQGNWTATFEDLPEFANGVAINYGVVEIAVDGYDAPSYSGTMASGFIVTNVRTPETMDIDVIKVWDDEDNQDGFRPSAVTIQLFVEGQAEPADSITLTAADADADGNWAGVFEDVRVYANGSAITYTVGEVTVDEYDSVVTGNQTDGFTVTNTHVPYVVTIHVSKTWVDDDDRDGLRTDTATMYLTVNGVKDASQSIVLSEAENWSGEFNDLPKFADGVQITYGVIELAVEGYETEIVDETPATADEGDVEMYFSVTNTHEPQTIQVVVAKQWKDGNNMDRLRPESVIFTLLANGEPIDEVTLDGSEYCYLTEDHRGMWWVGYFNDLPVYENGEKIEYSVEEIEVDEYICSMEMTSDDEENPTALTFWVTNFHAVPYVPHTADGSNLPLWLGLSCFSALGLVLTGIMGRRREEGRTPTRRVR